MTSPPGPFRLRPKSLGPYLKDPRFWAVQALVIAIAVTHNILESSEELPSDLVDFLPVSFLWIPLLYGSLRYGMAGAIATSAVVLVTSLPNWFYLQRTGTLPQEVSLVAIAVAISLLVGRQTDRRLDAQRSAKDYAAYAVRSQEEERRRLSLDLHDDPVQTLIAVGHELDSLKDLNSQGAMLADARNSIAEVVRKLRDIGSELHPPALDDMGVVSAVRGMLSDLSRKDSFASGFNVNGEPRRLPAETEVAIFRIAQEALRNAARHAAASRVSVDITFAAKEVVLEVLDDGVGFDASGFRYDQRGHFGLLGMKERSEMMGGRFEISSAPGKGTRVAAHLPVLSA